MGKAGTDSAHWQQWYDTMLINRQWRMSLIARLVKGLKDTPEGTGSMLDTSLVFNTSEFTCGTEHSARDLPILLVGKAGNQLKTGRYLTYNTKAASNPQTLDYASNVSTHNLFTTFLNLFGYPDTTFGNADAAFQGPISGVT